VSRPLIDASHFAATVTNVAAALEAAIKTFPKDVCANYGKVEVVVTVNNVPFTVDFVNARNDGDGLICESVTVYLRGAEHIGAAINLVSTDAEVVAHSRVNTEAAAA
jgi:hypothetical protein